MPSVSQKGDEREIIKGTYLFCDFFAFIIIAPLSPVKWGSRRVALYLREELDILSNVLFSIHGYRFAIFKEILDYFFGMRIVAITPIAEAITNLLRRRLVNGRAYDIKYYQATPDIIVFDNMALSRVSNINKVLNLL